MAITAKDVKALRDQTGLGMMDCKKALVEADGDMDKAITILREKGLAKAAKKADRIAAEGIVDILISDDGKTAAMVEVNSESDFVAKNDKFKEFVKDVLKTIIATRPADMDALMAEKFNGTDSTVEQALVDIIAIISEKISIRRFVIVDGYFGTYIHGGGVAGVIVKFDTDDAIAATAEFKEMAKNVCLQVAAMPVRFVNRDSVPASVLESEKEIIMAQIKNDPKNASKPDEIIEKMSVGRLGKFYKDSCLAEQEYVKDDKLSVQQYIDSVAKSLSADIKLVSYEKMEKGEGIEKKEDNYIEEIQQMAAGKVD